MEGGCGSVSSGKRSVCSETGCGLWLLVQGWEGSCGYGLLVAVATHTTARVMVQLFDSYAYCHEELLANAKRRQLGAYR